MKKYIFSFLALFVMPAIAMAAEFKTSDRLSITIPIGDDIYVAGGQVKINSNVDGDLIAAGGELEINGDVSGDIIAGGGRVRINSNVGDDVRVAGGEINVQSNIGDDLIMTGGTVYILKGSEIGGDLIISGGEIRVDGAVKGKVIANGGRVILNGEMLGNVEVNGGEIEIDATVKGVSKLVAKEIIVGEESNFSGSVEYWTKKGEVDFGTANAIFNQELSQKAHKTNIPFGAFTGFKIICFLASVLLIYLLLFAKKFFINIAQNFEKNIWKNFGLGFLYFALTPVIVLILFITLIGFPVGLVLMFLYIISFVLLVPLTAIVLAHVWKNKSKAKWKKWQLLAACVGVYVILKIVISIPFIGFIAAVLTVFSCFGAIISEKWNIAKKFF